MSYSVLIIDDERIQAEGLKVQLLKKKTDLFVQAVFKENDISNVVESTFYNLAIVDLNFKEYEFDGFDIIKDIIELNPFAKIIIVSAYLDTYSYEVSDIIKTGRINLILKKKPVEKLVEEIVQEIENDIVQIENNLNFISQTLENLYAEAKNEKDNYIKGLKFERFTSILFGQMGFNHISKRFKDKSLNEVDLIIRNDIDDLFFQKFSPYFLIECKNTFNKIDKNTFIIFLEKIRNTNNLANLGFIVSSGSIKRNTYIEAVRSSKDKAKVVFISNIEIRKLIYSNDLLETLKIIIDEQVKDN